MGAELTKGPNPQLKSKDDMVRVPPAYAVDRPDILCGLRRNTETKSPSNNVPRTFGFEAPIIGCDHFLTDFFEMCILFDR
jgi:hypothetical protein